MKLFTINNVSVDGYTEDERGSFDFTEPDDEVFAFITDLIRPVGIHLYGRRMYETMCVWETDPRFAAESALAAEFANVWMAADKVVYSSTLDAVSTERTRLERTFEPETVRAMKSAATGDLTISGPSLAARAFEAGLVDEYHLFVAPVALGRGKPALMTSQRVDLDLIDERRFDSGTLYLRYGVRASF